MNYLGRFIDNFRYAYKEINSATLTGAIDIIVVEQPDGSFTCSPFHVRFGKLGVLRSREKIVEIEINGEPLNIYMKLGESGEAFFVEEVDDDLSIPEHLVCSPIPDSEESGDQEIVSGEVNRNDDYCESGDTEKVDDATDAKLDTAVLVSQSLSNGNVTSSINEAISADNDITKNRHDDVVCNETVTDANTVEQFLNSDAIASDNGDDINNNSNNNNNSDKRPIKVLNNVKSDDVIRPPKGHFKPIRSISDNEECYDSVKREEKDFHGHISNISRKSMPSIVKRKRKKKVQSKKKSPQTKNHDDVFTDNITIMDDNDDADDGCNDDESKRLIANVNDLHDNTSMQNDDLVDDEVTELEADLNTSGNNQVPMTAISDLHFFSDTEVTTNASNYERPFSPIQSDTEFEIASRHVQGNERVLSENGSSSLSVLSHTSWKWGELPSTVSTSQTFDAPVDKTEVETKHSAIASMLGFMKRTKHIRQKSSELKDGGMYLSKLLASELDPDTVSLYIPHSSGSESNTVTNEEGKLGVQRIVAEDDSESGNGPSLPQSPSSELETQIESPKKSDRSQLDIAISLCGSLYPSDSVPSEDLFNQHLIMYEQFVNDPSIFKNPNLVFRLNGNMYKWETACPLILSLALFGKSLPEDTVNRLEQERIARKIDEENKSRYRRGYYSWFNWARSRQHKSTDKDERDGETKSLEKVPLLPSKSSPALVSGGSFNGTEITNIIGEGMELNTPTPSNHDAEKYRLRTYSSSESEEYEPESELVIEKPPEKYRKTLRLTSQQIASLNLRDGSNEVVFSVTTAYQGTTRCWCNLFKWRYDDKIVVSDIDGTITKSDVLGHIMPIVGNNWAQSGVAKLFNKIKDNGYQLLYLSSRAIGQSKGTRKYLCSIKQEDLTLPEGPLLLNPTSLLTAFHREVIEKKPEKFKISCLRDIQALFPPDSNPFYAGYGNRINDVWSYQAVGIPIFRIFTINHRGELKHELTQTFQSSYTNMSQIADQLFPVQAKRNTAEDFSNFIYWRDPLPDIDEDLLRELKTA